MREYGFNGLAGCVVQQRSRATKLLVGLYRADQAQMDATAGAWATVCEEHGSILNHSTIALARAHLVDPRGWCSTCAPQAEQEAP